MREMPPGMGERGATMMDVRLMLESIAKSLARIAAVMEKIATEGVTIYSHQEGPENEN